MWGWGASGRSLEVEELVKGRIRVWSFAWFGVDVLWRLRLGEGRI